MCTEIEAKLKVDSHKKIVAKLNKLGAEFVEEQLQKDCFFDDGKAVLKKTDRCLRLRRQLVGEKERIFLTYKGAKQKDNFKKRREIEIEVAQAHATEQLLSAIGFERALVFEKKRQLWRLGQCEVALDKLPLLGDFVEIEGPDDQIIADVQKSLGLSDSPSIKQSYAFLLDKELSRLGKEQRQVFLESQDQ